MKKLLLIVILFSAAFSIFADLKKPSRRFESGVDVEAGISNSYFNAEELLVKNLVIDFRKIADGIGDSGYVMDFATNVHTYAGISGAKRRLSFFLDVDGSGYVNFPEEVFDILGYGVNVGDDKDFTIHAYGDIFISTGVSYFKKWNDFAITVTPSYYVPVLYIDDIQARVQYSLKEDGHISARMEMPVEIYSALDLQMFIDKTYSPQNIINEVKGISAKGGFDLGLTVEKKIVRSFDAALYTRIPVIPGHLSHKATKKIWAYGFEDNALGFLDETENREYDYGSEEMVYSSADKMVFRPLRFGFEGTWRPFGDWATFTPAVGFAVRNPYTGPAVWYMEGGLIMDFRILHVLGLNFASVYKNRVWTQRAGILFNVHFFEIGCHVGFRSGDFDTSFSPTGATLGVTVKWGF